MRVLAIDTATWQAAVCLWEDGRELAFAENKADRDQAAILPGLVQQVLGDLTVDLVLVNRGPGSFTGIRLGLAFAQGLAMGWGVPVKGIDGFTAIHHKDPKDGLILIEARREDIYGQVYQKGVAQKPRSYTMAEVEAFPGPITRAGSDVRALISAFFADSGVAGEAVPLYIREADVSFPAPCSN